MDEVPAIYYYHNAIRCRELSRLICYEGLTCEGAGRALGLSKARVTHLLRLASEEIRFFSRYTPNQ